MWIKKRNIFIDIPWKTVFVIIVIGKFWHHNEKLIMKKNHIVICEMSFHYYNEIWPYKLVKKNEGAYNKVVNSCYIYDRLVLCSTQFKVVSFVTVIHWYEIASVAYINEVTLNWYFYISKFSLLKLWFMKFEFVFRYIFYLNFKESFVKKSEITPIKWLKF